MERGQHETELLRINVNDQLNRLFTQLEDLEELKDEFEDEQEYNETKEETLSQLVEFQAFLEKAISGDMTLVNEFGNAQLAIEQAVSGAFKTPEVIRLFAKKQPDSLRKRFVTLERDLKLKKIDQAMFNRSGVEIVMALKKLGEELTSAEQAFLDSHSSSRLLESATNDIAQTRVQRAASAQINEAGGQ